MSKLIDVLKKFKIETQADGGIAVCESLDLFGDKHKISIRWSDDNIRVDKVILNNSEYLKDWSASFSFKNRLRLMSSEGIPEDLSGAIYAIKYIAKQISLSSEPEIVSSFIKTKVNNVNSRS